VHDFDPDLTLTGTLNPDVTGNYRYVGIVNGVDSYKHVSLDWYIWDSTYGTWLITQIAGDNSPPAWGHSGLTPWGDYVPIPTATGTATATPWSP